MEKECLDLLKQIRNMHDKHPHDITLIVASLYYEYDCGRSRYTNDWENNAKYYCNIEPRDKETRGNVITEFSSSFFFDHSEIERDIEVAYRICMDLQEKGILKASISKTKANEFYVQYTIRIPKNNSAAK